MKDIEKARRYLRNAGEMLRKNEVDEDGIYNDRKHVKIAGNRADSGVLAALDAVLGNKTSDRKTLDWYEEQLTNIDPKILPYFLTAYDVLYLAMGYDGNLIAAISRAGLDIAEKIINWAEQKTAA